MLTQMMSVGVYDIPKVHFTAVTSLTNNTTIGAYRGAGRPEATQLIERVLDVAADKIGIDPAEIRRVQLHAARHVPAHHHHRRQLRLGRVRARRSTPCSTASGYAELRAEQAARRAAGDAKQLGIGVSTYVEVTAPVGLHVEYGAVRGPRRRHGHACSPAPACTARATTPPSPCSPATCSASRWTRSSSSTPTPRTVPRGAGTMGSRSLQTAGSAIHVASDEVLDRAKQIAAHLLEAVADDIVVGDGGLQVAGVPLEARVVGRPRRSRRRTRRSCPTASSPASLRHELDFDGTDSTFPFGAHVSVVEVDTETGGVTMLRHVAVDDCGRILNPMLVAGQQHGGIAQGAAQALYEWVQYDDDGNPITSNLMDYAIPSAAELCSFETSNTQTDSPRNPLGRQGHRRVGHDRLDAGHPERRRRRRVPPRRHPHRHALHRRAGVGGDPERSLIDVDHHRAS